MSQVSGVAGAVDGSHIPIIAPKESVASYINRRGFHSVLLQGVCDEKKMFIDWYAGEVGSIHDACLFRRSELGRRFGDLQFPQDGHLLGDSAYSLTTKLLVPYKDNGHLTNIEKNFNKQHSKCRVYIEQTFAYLKRKIPQIKVVRGCKIPDTPYNNMCMYFT
ncbi:hypothetical protein NQ314_012680 [Rhamnusium bicolor]|uniref:DDE Tnp4 domain-containing protein n=1 Tax=Rhamnusium bicolor TaxID=1586634 RepID=A0AAV8X9Z6_9CUCU|nr:hypothetical protein NQ314_012680 [Rhamnusium bicolor]